MEKVNPHMTKHDPKEAIAAVNKQFKAYLEYRGIHSNAASERITPRVLVSIFG
ncbi:hypothetical protein GALMADRAFT_254799 [Galerina marginata CBS 339.88]|uniref:Uncharacterized protein n=1 Tax=Galerina marginata (strain CBS 339.88) TaxID=685588 RepID=A0A067SVE9_GALM3|nr:hypothetical protein GALMADRAFT_254799 [Galerina marginata CBS 339.88]